MFARKLHVAVDIAGEHDVPRIGAAHGEGLTAWATPMKNSNQAKFNNSCRLNVERS